MILLGRKMEITTPKAAEWSQGISRRHRKIIKPLEVQQEAALEMSSQG
jgi:hypothetical protein